MTTTTLARSKILEGLSIALDGETPALPKQSFWLGDSDQLAREQVMTALLAFDLTLDLTSCNSGGRNLYEVLDLYLRNAEAREEINAVLRLHGKDIN